MNEWVIGRITAASPRGDVLVDVFLVIEDLQRHLLGIRVTGPSEEPATLDNTEAARGGTLADALRRAQRPGQIRVADFELAREAIAILQGVVPMQLAPTPEIDAMAPDLLDVVDVAVRFATVEADETLLALRELYEAAAMLWAASPWDLVDDMLPLRLTISALGIENGCLLVLAGHPSTRHIAFFESPDDCLGFLMRIMFGHRGDDPDGLGGAFLSLQFRQLDASPHSPAGSSLEGAARYPVVTPHGRDGSTRPTTLADLRVMAACCRALSAFTITHRAALSAANTGPLEVELREPDGSEIYVRLDTGDDERVLH